MRTATAIILGAAALAAPAQAQAQEQAAERPQPGCAGVNFSDPRGDVANAGLDVVSGFLTTKDGAVYANLVVRNLDRRVDQPDMSVEWFVAGWSTEEDSDSASAHLRADGSTDGGTFFEGHDGVVQMQLPGVSPTTPVRLWAYSGADRDPLVAAPPGGDPSVSVFLLGETTEEIEGNVQAASCPAAPAPEPAPASSQPASGQPSRPAAPRARRDRATRHRARHRGGRRARNSRGSRHRHAAR